MTTRPRVSTEDILLELKALREQIETVGPGAASAGKHSNWSAHGNWSNSSAKLPGNIDLRSSLSVAQQPVIAAQLDKIIADASSSNLLKVAESLAKQLGG